MVMPMPAGLKNRNAGPVLFAQAMRHPSQKAMAVPGAFGIVTAMKALYSMGKRTGASTQNAKVEFSAPKARFLWRITIARDTLTGAYATIPIS